MQIKVEEIKSTDNTVKVFLKAFEMGREAAEKAWSE